MKKQNIEEVKSTSVNSIIEKVIPQPSAEQIGQESWLRNNLLLDKVETGLIKARFQGIEKVVVPVSPKAAKLLTSNLSWKEHLSDSMAPVKECTIIIPRETNVVGGKQTNLSLQEDQLSVMSSANKRGVEKIKVIFSSNSDKYIHYESSPEDLKLQEFSLKGFQNKFSKSTSYIDKAIDSVQIFNPAAWIHGIGNAFRNGLPNADTRIIKVLTTDRIVNLNFTSEYNDKKSKIEAEVDFIGSAFLEFELNQTPLVGRLDEQQHCCGCELF